jgi:hypothetical protein
MKKIVITTILVLFCATFAFWWLWGGNFQGTSYVGLHETEKTVIKGSNVSLAISDILIFKTPHNEIGAIQFKKMTPDSGADYTSWFIPSSSVSKSFQNIKAKEGHVFEKYWRTRTGLNSYHVTDIGGNYTIECGPIKLNWSASTWVYFPPEYEIAVISNRDIDDINISDLTLEWHKT